MLLIRKQQTWLQDSHLSVLSVPLFQGMKPSEVDRPGDVDGGNPMIEGDSSEKPSHTMKDADRENKGLG